MKKSLFVCLLLTFSIFSLTSCKSGKGCGGGGWYGKRNLEITVDVCLPVSSKVVDKNLSIAP